MYCCMGLLCIGVPELRPILIENVSPSDSNSAHAPSTPTAGARFRAITLISAAMDTVLIILVLRYKTETTRRQRFQGVPESSYRRPVLLQALPVGRSGTAIQRW